MFDELKSQSTAPGFKEILVPGEPELRRSGKRTKEGCPLSADTVELLGKLGKDFGVEFPNEK